MIWRCGNLVVLREDESTYWVVDGKGAVVGTHESKTWRERSVRYWRHFYVSGDCLVEQTSVWSKWNRGVTNTIMSGLVYDDTETTRQFLATLALPAAGEVLEELERLEQLKPAIGMHEALNDFDRGELFRIVQHAVIANYRHDDKLSAAMLTAMVDLGRAKPSDPTRSSDPALVAFSRACWLAYDLDRNDLPEIDEQSVPVRAPELGRQIAELADQLDDAGRGEAADAMETCARLLGYRRAK